MHPWERVKAQQETQAPATAGTPTVSPSPTPAPSPVAMVTPATGPPGQDPPKPIVIQNALVGAGTTAMTNMLTTGLTGDPDLIKFGLICNAAAQIVKQHPKFNEKLWTLPLMIFVGIAVAVYFYHDPTKWNPMRFWEIINPKGVIDGATSAVQAAMNYHGLSATGVSPFKPVPFANSVEGQQQQP